MFLFQHKERTRGKANKMTLNRDNIYFNMKYSMSAQNEIIGLHQQKK